MDTHRYSKTFRLMVVQESLRPESNGLEQVVAEKYGIRYSTLIRWQELYQEFGEEGLSKGKLSKPSKSKRELELERENAELREEVQILKKAAAFLADARRG